MNAAMPVALLGWKPLHRNSLRGFACVRLGKSLQIKDLPVHNSGGKRWVGMPGKAVLDASGNAKRTDAGKVVYVPVLEWSDKDSAARFGEAVVAAIEAAHPGDLADEVPA